MLISRLALSLFWFPGVCPLRLEYFHIPQKDYGFLFLFSLFNFQGPVRSVFLSSAWLFYHISLCLSRTFFRSFSEVFSEKSFSILSHLSMFVKNFFAPTFRGTFLSYHNHSRFVKIFFRSVERLTILPRFLSPVNAFFRFFSPFSSVCKICQFFPHFFHFSGTAIFSLSSVYFPLYQQILLAKERCSWRKKDCSCSGRSPSFYWSIFWWYWQ